MEMHQIRYFLAVCSERNFTRAARLCNVSQPSLTRAIQLLEAEFGGFLFRREHANSRLTELGEIVRPHLQEVWEQSHAAKTHAHEFAALTRSRLRIGVMCTIAPMLLVDLLARVRTHQKTIELQIVDGAPAELEEQLLRDQISVAVYCKPERETDLRLNYLPLFREQMLIAMSQNHRLANHVSLRIEDLAGEQYVRRSRCEFNDFVERFLRERGIECEMSCSSERDDWALALIGSGFGLGLLPQHTINHPDVVSRPLTDPELWREVNLVTVKGRPHSKGLGAFVHEAMQATWASEAALAIQKHRSDKQG
jgi:DNA-binding transcriptional LysR family regulator